MTHIVLGYPSFEMNRQVVREMVENGVDCIEMQIPFSEPMADGPVILKANQSSIATGTKVADCMAFGKEMSETYDIPFLFMTYYNIIFKYGEMKFFNQAKECDIKGLIVPDLPPEEAADYLAAMARNDLAPIFIYSPSTTDERMAEIAQHAQGFVYCVARKGVTGAETAFSDEFGGYLSRCRRATDLPLALGFGVKDKADVDFLRGQVDIAVIGTQTIRVMEEHGVGAVKDFIQGLR